MIYKNVIFIHFFCVLVNEIVEVSGFDPIKLGRLRMLELRGNKLMTTVGLSNLPNLKELYMVRYKQIH